MRKSNLVISPLISTLHRLKNCPRSPMLGAERPKAVSEGRPFTRWEQVRHLPDFNDEVVRDLKNGAPEYLRLPDEANEYLFDSSALLAHLADGKGVGLDVFASKVGQDLAALGV